MVVLAIVFILPSVLYQLAWYWFSETHECTRWQREGVVPHVYSACVEWKRR